MLHADQIHKHISTLNNGDDASQRQAIHALTSIEPEDWGTSPRTLMNPLLASLQRAILVAPKPPVVHKEIAIILGKLGERSKCAVPQLIELLQEGIADSVREAAAMALGRLGKDAKDAVDALVAICKEPTPLSLHAIRALAEIGCADNRVRSALVKVWLSASHSQDGLLQVAIALCRLKIHVKGLVAFLTNHLIKSQGESCRKAAAEALAWCTKTDTDVVPALVVAALNDKNEDVRQTAQASLDQQGLPAAKAIVICAKQLKDSLYAEAALRKSGPNSVPALIEALGSTDSTVRVKAAQILASLGEPAVEAAPALTLALRDRNPEIRLAAAKGLWNVTKKADDAVPVLAKLLEDERATDFEDGDDRRRFLQTVIEALWRIGPAAITAAPALILKTKDNNRLVAQSAQNAVQKIAPGRAK